MSLNTCDLPATMTPTLVRPPIRRATRPARTFEENLDDEDDVDEYTIDDALLEPKDEETERKRGPS